eukprot:SAG31_NODE_1675_length_7552_cov_69.287228_5_plen_136_part_00
MWPAHLYEKLGAHDAAMECCGLALEIDQSKGGDVHPHIRALAQQCRARLLAAQGQIDEAEAAYEAAITEAGTADLRLLEAMAIRDLSLLPNGCEKENEQRLSKVNIVASKQELPCIALQRRSTKCDGTKTRQSEL